MRFPHAAPSINDVRNGEHRFNVNCSRYVVTIQPSVPGRFERCRQLTNCTDMASSSLGQIKRFQFESVTRGKLGTDECETSEWLQGHKRLYPFQFGILHQRDSWVSYEQLCWRTYNARLRMRTVPQYLMWRNNICGGGTCRLLVVS